MCHSPHCTLTLPPGGDWWLVLLGEASTAWGQGGRGPTNHSNKTLDDYLLVSRHFIGHISQHPQGNSTHRNIEQPTLGHTDVMKPEWEPRSAQL